MNYDDDRFIPRNISMRASDWAAVEAHSDETGIDNTSATIRSIIREHQQLRAQVAQLKAAMWQLAKEGGVEVPDVLLTL